MGFISRVRVIRSLVFCVVFCRSLFVLFLFVIVLSVIPRFTDSDYPFGIFKLLSYPCNGHQLQPQNRGDYVRFFRDQEFWPFNGSLTTATEETRGPPKHNITTCCSSGTITSLVCARKLRFPTQETPVYVYS
jgi:hypothetical protein